MFNTGIIGADKKALEELTLKSIRNIQKKYLFDNLGLSGGVCSNVRLNQKISELKGVKDLFVYPPMTLCLRFHFFLFFDSIFLCIQKNIPKTSRLIIQTNII